MRIATLFALVLSLATSLLAAAGHEIGDHSTGPTAYGLSNASVAISGSKFLSVWRVDTFGGGAHVYGALSSGNGIGGAIGSFPVLTGADARSVRLLTASNDTDNVLFWSDPAGAVHMTNLDPSTHKATSTVDPGITGSGIPAVAWNGSRFAVVLPRTLAGGASVLSGYILRRDGSIEHGPITVWGDTSPSIRLASFPDGDFALTLWSRTLGIKVARFGADGTARDLSGISVAGPGAGYNINAADIEGVAGNVVVVWAAVNNGANELKSALITPAGSVQNIRTLPDAPATVYGIDLTPAGTGLVAAMNVVTGLPTDPAVVALRLDASGAARDSSPQVLGTNANGRTSLSAVAATSSTIYATALEVLKAGSHVVGLWASSGSVGREIVSNSEVRQTGTVIATDGSGFLALWLSRTADSSALMAQRLGRDGQSLGNPLTVATTDGTFGNFAVGSNGSSFLVVWVNGQQLFGRRVNPGGAAFLDAANVIRNGTVDFPAVASNGSDYLVVWNEQTRIYGALVTSGGAITSAQKLTPDVDDILWWHIHNHPAAAWNGSKYLLAWTEQRFAPCISPPCAEEDDVKALRVGGNGLPLDGASTFVITKASHPSVASNGSSFLVAASVQEGTDAAFVRENNGSLQADASFNLFRWFAPVPVAVTYDGQQYAASWRYSGGTHAWVATGRIAADGAITSRRGAETGLMEGDTGIANAATTSGLVIATADFRSAGGVSRAIAARLDELSDLPAAPQPPSSVQVRDAGNGSYVISWSEVSGTSGVIVEARTRDIFYIAATVPAGTNSITLNYAPPPFRVRSWNAGGLSAPSAEVTPVAGAPSKRRIAGH